LGVADVREVKKERFVSMANVRRSLMAMFLFNTLAEECEGGIDRAA
jgi:protein-tyrosine-phosphatase